MALRPCDVLTSTSMSTCPGANSAGTGASKPASMAPPSSPASCPDAASSLSPASWVVASSPASPNVASGPLEACPASCSPASSSPALLCELELTLWPELAPASSMAAASWLEAPSPLSSLSAASCPASWEAVASASVLPPPSCARGASTRCASGWAASCLRASGWLASCAVASGLRRAASWRVASGRALSGLPVKASARGASAWPVLPASCFGDGWPASVCAVALALESSAAASSKVVAPDEHAVSPARHKVGTSPDKRRRSRGGASRTAQLGPDGRASPSPRPHVLTREGLERGAGCTLPTSQERSHRVQRVQIP